MACGKRKATKTRRRVSSFWVQVPKKRRSRRRTGKKGWRRRKRKPKRLGRRKFQ